MGHFTDDPTFIWFYLLIFLNGNLGFPAGSDSKESACNAGDLGPIPGLGRSPEGGHDVSEKAILFVT